MQHVFDYKEGEVFACVSVLGWITGHTYVVYGPLCNGATTVLFEGTATYPDPGIILCLRLSASSLRESSGLLSMLTKNYFSLTH